VHGHAEGPWRVACLPSAPPGDRLAREPGGPFWQQLRSTAKPKTAACPQEIASTPEWMRGQRLALRLLAQPKLSAAERAFPSAAWRRASAAVGNLICLLCSERHALDILRDSASQGALAKAVLQEQGQITEAGYKEQAQSYQNTASAAQVAINADNQASVFSTVTGALKIAAGISRAILGGPAGAAAGETIVDTGMAISMGGG